MMSHPVQIHNYCTKVHKSYTLLSMCVFEDVLIILFLGTYLLSQTSKRPRRHTLLAKMTSLYYIPNAYVQAHARACSY